MELRNGMQVGVTPEAAEDHNVDASQYSKGDVLDVTADGTGAFVFFHKRGATSFWHHTELREV